MRQTDNDLKVYTCKHVYCIAFNNNTCSHYIFKHSGNRVDHLIIMAQKEAENTKRKIVIGMDGSKNSEEAFKCK